MPRRRVPLLHAPSKLSRSARASLHTTTNTTNSPSSTMSLVDEKHEWGASKVRDTFINYFKDRGHTFGESHAIAPPPIFLLQRKNGH